MATKVIAVGLALVGAASGFSLSSGVSSVARVSAKSSATCLSMSAGIGATKSVKPDDNRRGEGVFKGIPAGFDPALVEAMNSANKVVSYDIPADTISAKFGSAPTGKAAPRAAAKPAAKPALRKPAAKPAGRPGAKK